MFKFTISSRVIALLCCLAAVTLCCTSASAQNFTTATATNAKQLVGVWRARFKGKPFFTVELAIDGNRLVGTASRPTSS